MRSLGLLYNMTQFYFLNIILSSIETKILLQAVHDSKCAQTLTRLVLNGSLNFNDDASIRLLAYILDKCKELEALPPDMGNLVNLKVLLMR